MGNYFDEKDFVRVTKENNNALSNSYSNANSDVGRGRITNISDFSKA